MKVINYIVLIISIIGCVNWGLIGLFDFNLVDMLFGTGSILSRAVYILVGICGIYQLSFFSSLNNERKERIRLSAVCRRLFLFAL